MIFLLCLLLLVGCGDYFVSDGVAPEIYNTKCPQVELGEHIGYLSIEGIDNKSYAYWACVGQDCTQRHMNKYAVEVRPLGDDVSRERCGCVEQRAYRVNEVVSK